MAFLAEAVARLRLDTTDFQRGLTRTTAAAAQAGHDINRKLHRAFGAGDVFKGMLMGLGIGSVEKAVDTVSRLMSGLSEEAEKNYKELTELSDRNTEATIENMRKLADEEIKYQLLLKDRKRALENPTEGFTPRKPGYFENLFKFLSQNKITGTLLSGIFGGPALALEESRTEENKSGETAAREQAKARAIKADAEKKEIDKKRAEEKKKAEDDIAKRRDKVAQDEKDFAREQMQAEQQIAELRRDQLAIDYLLTSNQITALEAREKTLAIEIQIARIKKQQNEEEARKKKESEHNARRLLDAGEAVTEARQDYATGLRDRSGFTVGDVAAGRAGNATSRARSRQVLALEARARRIRNMGDYRDAKGKLVDPNKAADDMINRADALRQKISGLTSDERNPMKSMAENIKKSEKHLDDIVKELTPENVAGGTSTKGKAGGSALKKK